MKTTGFLLLLFFVIHCSWAQLPDNDSLSKFRPRYSPTAKQPVAIEQKTEVVEPTRSINEQLNIYLDTVAAANRKLDLAAGFRVVLYSGNDRDMANKAKSKAYKVDPNADIYLLYTQPSFKVKAGDFFTRLEAELALVRYRPDFPDAIIVEDKVSVRGR